MDLSHLTEYTQLLEVPAGQRHGEHFIPEYQAKVPVVGGNPIMHYEHCVVELSNIEAQRDQVVVWGKCQHGIVFFSRL